ncbi:MarR family transcriptional regulator [Paenibacillus flagellatus]|uniref:MarR family transcriptional regulator n=2 Tax=Paenibacillus flagellatus TaxID=2211139 RepID=A0A2V5K315_9BACL|nr:MarR family transcriptional regulator [Paenibacillus flagellatus]
MNDELLKDIIGRYERVTFTVERRLNALIRELMPDGITIDQYAILRYIASRSMCTSSELSDTFYVGKSSITAIITRLFEKKLLKRIPDEKDRRVTYLALTEEGERMTEEMCGSIQRLLSKYIQHFDEQEAIAFITTFEKLGRVLTDG